MAMNSSTISKASNVLTMLLRIITVFTCQHVRSALVPDKFTIFQFDIIKFLNEFSVYMACPLKVKYIVHY